MDDRQGRRERGWTVDYADGNGVRRLKTFSQKKEADAFAATAKVEIRDGVHVADSASISVRQAGALWIASGESADLERSTVNQRKRHLKHHIDPFIGEHPAVEADGAGHPRLRGPAAPGGPVGRDAAQGSGFARLDPDRFAGTRTFGPQSGQGHATAPAARARSTRQRSAARASSRSAWTFRPPAR